MAGSSPSNRRAGAWRAPAWARGEGGPIMAREVLVNECRVTCELPGGEIMVESY